MTNKKRREAYRDGLLLFTEGEVIETDAAIVELLYKDQTSDERVYFAEIKGKPLCAHGDSIEEAIEEARFKERGRELSEEEKTLYRDKDFKFTVTLFRRLTGACQTGINAWLEQKGFEKNVKMTLSEFKKAGGGEWAEALERAIND